MDHLSFIPKTNAALVIAIVVAGCTAWSAAEGQDWGYDPGYGVGGAVGGAVGGPVGGAVGGAVGGRGLFKGSSSVFAYDYLDLGYFNYTFDDADVDSATGFGGEFSIPVISILYAKASLSYATPDTSDGEDLDYLAWELGGGIGIPLTSKLDLVIEGGLAREKFVSDILDDPIDGYGFYVAPGLRLMLADFLELNGGVTITSIDSNQDIGLDFKALMHLTPRLSVFGSANYSDDVSQYGLGLRLSF